MFTGLVREIGEIARRTGAGLALTCPALLPEIALGDSVAVNGVCLTARSLTADGFEADVSRETFDRSTLGQLRTGARVNLEPALALGERLGGHIVQGHVDDVGTCVVLRPSGEGFDLTIAIPAAIQRYVAVKGSIAIDGVSLTVAGIEGDRCRVAVIPHTWQSTNLQYLRSGQRVNVEVDIFAKYVERLLGRDTTQSAVNEEFLREHGFMI